MQTFVVTILDIVIIHLLLSTTAFIMVVFDNNFAAVPIYKKLCLCYFAYLYLLSTKFQYWILKDIEPTVSYEKFLEITK